MMNDYTMEEILPVLAERVRKYTSNDSTSVSYDTARQLMSSVLYCLQDCASDESTENMSGLLDVNHKTPANEAFKIGLARRKGKIIQAKQIYQDICQSFYAYQNNCYNDTIIKGMPAFFEWYDVEFDATNHILTLDYPLLYHVPEQVGIDLIYEYLLRTQLEQRFLNKFSADTVEAILEGYHKNHAELTINICKLVLRNAIGCMLLGKSIYKLTISDEDREKLKEISENQSIREHEKILSSAFDRMMEEEFEGDLKLFDYLNHDIKEFAYEYKAYSQKNALDHFFLGIRTEKPTNETIFEDGIPMDDEALRSLIDELRDMRFLSDKLVLLKKQIKSLADLKEVLKESFFEDEYEEVFRLLSDHEMKVLQNEIALKFEYTENLDEWENALKSRK